MKLTMLLIVLVTISNVEGYIYNISEEVGEWTSTACKDFSTCALCVQTPNCTYFEAGGKNYCFPPDVFPPTDWDVQIPTGGHCIPTTTTPRPPTALESEIWFWMFLFVLVVVTTSVIIYLFGKRCRRRWNVLGGRDNNYEDLENRTGSVALTLVGGEYDSTL